MSAAAAVIFAKQKQAIRAFQDVGATSPTTTRRLDELNIRECLPVRGLIRHGVLVETSEGRYYLDTGRADAFARARRVRAIAIISIVVVAIALILILK